MSKSYEEMAADMVVAWIHSYATTGGRPTPEDVASAFEVIYRQVIESKDR